MIRSFLPACLLVSLLAFPTRAAADVIGVLARAEAGMVSTNMATPSWGYGVQGALQVMGFEFFVDLRALAPDVQTLAVKGDRFWHRVGARWAMGLPLPLFGHAEAFVSGSILAVKDASKSKNFSTNLSGDVGGRIGWNPAEILRVGFELELGYHRQFLSDALEGAGSHWSGLLYIGADL